MTDVSPSDAIGDVDELEAVADAAENHGAVEGGETEISAGDVGGSSTSISDALMHTEPDLSPSSTLEEFGSIETHCYIGFRKVLASFGVAENATEDGTPAILNFATAGFSWLFGVDVADVGGGDDDGGNAGGIDAGAGADLDIDAGEIEDPAVGGASA